MPYQAPPLPFPPLLHCATVGGDFEMVKKLLDEGNSPDEQDYEGNTALHLACRENRPDIAGILLDSGAKIYPKNHDEKTPLTLAEEAKSYATIQKIEECFLRRKAEEGNIAAVRMSLFVMGANPNASDRLGNTALHFAAAHQNTEVMDMLIIRGGNLNLKNESGLSPRDIITMGEAQRQQTARTRGASSAPPLTTIPEEGMRAQPTPPAEAGPAKAGPAESPEDAAARLERRKRRTAAETPPTESHSQHSAASSSPEGSWAAEITNERENAKKGKTDSPALP